MLLQLRQNLTTASGKDRHSSEKGATRECHFRDVDDDSANFKNKITWHNILPSVSSGKVVLSVTLVKYHPHSEKSNFQDEQEKNKILAFIFS